MLATMRMLFSGHSAAKYILATVASFFYIDIIIHMVLLPGSENMASPLIVLFLTLFSFDIIKYRFSARAAFHLSFITPACIDSKTGFRFAWIIMFNTSIIMSLPQYASSTAFYFLVMAALLVVHIRKVCMFTARRIFICIYQK